MLSRARHDDIAKRHRRGTSREAEVAMAPHIVQVVFEARSRQIGRDRAHAGAVAVPQRRGWSMGVVRVQVGLRSEGGRLRVA